jgi:RimJ/RimL family protein N-acetyltransferase
VALLVVRPAREDDCEFVYQLAMDPTVRGASTRSDEFTPEQHRQWWDRRFNDSSTRIYVAESDRPVGYVRYGRVKGRAEAEIAIAVDPSSRGRGIALDMLTMTQPLAAAALGVSQFTALVVVGNESSSRLFAKAGYEMKGWVARMGKQHRVYVKL